MAFVENKESEQPARADTIARAVAACKGVIVGENRDMMPGFNSMLTLCPPLNITDEDRRLWRIVSSNP